VPGSVLVLWKQYAAGEINISTDLCSKIFGFGSVKRRLHATATLGMAARYLHRSTLS